MQGAVCCCGGGDVICAAPDCASCAGQKLPLQVTFVDANGTWLSGPPGVFGGYLTWTATAFGSVPNADNRNPWDCVCTPSEGVIEYLLSVGCATNGSGWRMARTFAVPHCTPFFGDPFNCFDEDHGPPCYRSIGLPGDGGAQFFDSIALGSITSCNPLSWSVTLPAMIGGLPDPFGGGGVSVSAPEVIARSQVCCSPCPIPKKDLTLSWFNELTGHTGSNPLVFHNGNTWGVAHVNDAGDTMDFYMQCDGGGGIFVNMKGPGIPGPVGCTFHGGANNCLTLVDYTCNPFHLHIQAVVPGSPCICDSTPFFDLWIDE
jgi:hypothetical protein